MSEDRIPGPHKDFETTKHLDTEGSEYWQARELLPLLGYERWESAQEVVARAAAACMKSGQDVDDHFRQTTKMVKIGSNGNKKAIRNR
jgi:DNA-damage-inducible protein D